MLPPRALALGVVVLSACAAPPPAPVAPTQVAARVIVAAPPAPAVPAPPPARPPLAELRIAATHSLVAALNARDGQALRSLYADNASIVSGQGETHGAAGIVALAESVWTAFPDSKVQWGRLLLAGDTVAVELGWTGTSTAALGEHAAAHKVAGTSALLIEKFDDNGLIAAQRLYLDLENVTTALGWTPGKARAFDGLPTRQLVTADHTAPTAADDAPLRALRAALEAGTFRDALPLGTEASTWTDAGRRTVTGKGAIASWIGLLSPTYTGPGHVDAWAAGDCLVLEWHGSAGKATPAPRSAELVIFDGGKIAEVHTYR